MRILLVLLCCVFVCNLPPADAQSVVSDKFYFPGGETWEAVDQGQRDKSSDEALLNFLKDQDSSGLVVLHRGRIVMEHYWKPDPNLRASKLAYQRMVRGLNADQQPIEDVASAQKSVVAVLVGIAVQKQLLTIEQPVSKYLGAGWSKATPEQEGRITIKHLLSMSSGLNEDLTFEAAAGTRWKYNTAVYSRLVTVLEKASGKNRHELTRDWLTGRIGMKDSVWVDRANADRTPDNNQFGFATTCRDLARFGLMILAEGKWQGQTIIENDDYFKSMFRSSQKMNPLYGYLWWLNVEVENPSGGNAVARAMRGRDQLAPADLVAARGALGRRVIVVPSRQLVAVRIGAQPKADFDREFWQKLSKVTQGLK